MWKAALLVGLAVLALPQTRVATVNDETLRGAAFGNGRLRTWSSRLIEWDVETGKSRRIAASLAGFGEAGCVDRGGGVLLQDGEPAGPLVLIARNGKRTEWDRRVEMHDCLFTALLGRYGALITDHFGQVRFYEGPGRYTEIYSFYTPSRQAGLAVSRVDGDRLPDIYCGNYWIRSPKLFNLPWRLFAINTRHEAPDSATMRFAPRGRDLFAAQGHMKPGSLFRYRPSADPEALWEETVLASGLRFPHALAQVPSGIIVAESDGPGSGIFLVPDGGPVQRIATTDGIHSMFAVGERVLAAGPHAIVWWTISPAGRRRPR